VAYYDDGQALWGFIITRDQEIQAHRLPTTVDHYTYLLNCLYDKMDFALDLQDDPDLLTQLTRDTQEILRDMDQVVMAPLREKIPAHDKLIIVPYGSLHYVPFSALYDGHQYLIQQYDVTILPAASLVLRETPQHETMRARVIGHSWNGYLPSVIEEAEMVHQLCEGDLYIEADANVSALAGAACKILHICAHGEFRIDRPEISFIQLDDCQLYTDDLLQNDMHYQLVVLSSCETGRADIAPGDELIGLGRGFLYAGAGAVLTTLWRIESNHASNLMKTFYEHLLEGHTTDKALRLAQIALLSNAESQHPVFWAPFQLTGTAEALVSGTSVRN
jgi:CHAT domain-containing protein